MDEQRQGHDVSLNYFTTHFKAAFVLKDSDEATQHKDYHGGVEHSTTGKVDNF